MIIFISKLVTGLVPAIGMVKILVVLMNKDTNNPVSVIIALILLVLLVIWSSCSTNHYFSITSDSMENPNITYRDSVTLTNPF